MNPYEREVQLVEINYRPHKRQKKIHDALNKKRIVVVAAGRRFGKTKLALAWMIQRSIQSGEKSRVWYIGPTYKSAKMIAWKELLWMVPDELKDGKPNNTELMINLIGDRELALKGCEDPDSLRGPGLDGVVMDEYALMHPMAWEEVIEPALLDKKGKALFIGTPKKQGIHFKNMYEWAMKGGENGEAQAFLFSSLDNPYLDVELIKEKKEKLRKEGKLYIFSQEYEADFENTRGLVYPQFRRKYFPEGHLVEPFQIPAHWTTFVSLDPHDQTPTAVIVGSMSPDGVLYIHKDLFLGQMTVKEICKFIQENYPRVERYWGDSAVFKTNNTYEVGDSAGVQYRKNGINIIPVNKSLLDGHTKVREWLQFDETGKPKILFFDNLQFLVRQLSEYTYEDTRMEDDEDGKEKVSQKGKHFPDCLRYMIMGEPFYVPIHSQSYTRGTPFSSILENIKNKKPERIYSLLN